MAAYGLIISQDADGCFYISALNRGTTTTTFSGGTNLLTDTFTQTSATGALATASGFLATTNLTGVASSDSFKRRVCTPMLAASKAGEIMNNDRSFNG